MLLAVKTVKSDWCVSIRLLLVKKYVGLLLVNCLLCVSFIVVVKVTTNSRSQDYTHPDDHNLRTYDMTPGFKPFTEPTHTGRTADREQFTRSNAATARPLILVRPAEI